MGKPRMTQRDKWQKRPAVVRYRQFKDVVKLYRVHLDPAIFQHIVFFIRSALKDPAANAARYFLPHQQTPDKDNLEKALLDALFGDDKTVWDTRVSKVWSPVNLIAISPQQIELTPGSLQAIADFVLTKQGRRHKSGF